MAKRHRLSTETHPSLANFIWSICNLLRGPYKRNEYRKVILALTVLRRFDCLLAPTKAQVLAEHPKIKAKPESVVRSILEKITGRPFYNLSKLDLPLLLDDQISSHRTSTPTSTASRRTCARSWNVSRSTSRSCGWRKRTCSMRSSRNSPPWISLLKRWTTSRWATSSKS